MHYRYYSTKVQVFQEYLAPRRVPRLIQAPHLAQCFLKLIVHLTSGAYRKSGILPVRRYTKRLVQTSKSDKSNNPNGKQVGESAARGRFAQSVPWISMIAILLRATQDTRKARMRTPSRNKLAKKSKIQNFNSVLLIAISFMREEFESVRSTKKEIGTHKECRVLCYSLDFLSR